MPGACRGRPPNKGSKSLQSLDEVQIREGAVVTIHAGLPIRREQHGADQFDPEQFDTLVSHNRGLPIGFFARESEAVRWLFETPDA